MLKRVLISSAAVLFAAFPAAAMDITTELSESLQDKMKTEYGEREIDFLIERLEKRMRAELTKKEICVGSLELTLEDAEPSKPTFKQMADTPGLDYMRSMSLGGAKLRARALDKDDQVILDESFKWFERDLSHSMANGTWSDARRAFGIISRRVARELEKTT